MTLTADVDGRHSSDARPNGEGESSSRPKHRRRLPSDWLWLALPALAMITVLFAWPTFEALRRGFTDFQAPQVGGFDNFTWFLGESVNVTILVRTLVTGVAITIGCLLIAYPYAYLITVAKPMWRTVLLGVVLVQFCSSPVALTFAWVILLQDNGPVDQLGRSLGLEQLQLSGSVPGATIAMIQAMLPFMVLPLYATMSRIDMSLVRAAHTLGARPAVAFLKVYFPLSIPGVLAGSLLVFVISLGFYVTPDLLGSPNQVLLSQFLYTQISTLLSWGRGGAIAAVMIVATAVLLLAGRRFVGPAITSLGTDSRES
ncbi:MULTISPECIES: ABC transporter permease [Rhodococcus]|uniref:ABC transporter permease n=1 Tax=Rhodococcus TaxID=1827 RepID=UPI000BB0EEEA|nr:MULTISPECIES: ABC transporter permease [Rhodococcus]NDV04895.1 ABC transporter permease [Rhodococcus sp. IEGM 248]NHU45554.1 ABC transporter permease [Rhodococcus sp. A14]RYF60383.1 MAG: ABC transporter permease [Comamonadaceae bacterium]MDI9977333.1 ABC transporter permease [Rhodococcus sp. IEGM 1307]PBC51276.1 ABC transporter permease [Rhodococcus sp. ACPA1]